MALEHIRTFVERCYVFFNRQPWLTIRRILWTCTTGWVLALIYLALAVAMLFSIVFAPFSYQALRISVLALDGGITLEPFNQYLNLSLEAPIWGNPAHPYTIAANIVWAVLFGWAMAAAHCLAAILQAATIIGIGTALTNLQLAAFVIWPFGRSFRHRQLPTTLEELEQQRAAAAVESSAPLRWV